MYEMTWPVQGLPASSKDQSAALTWVIRGAGHALRGSSWRPSAALPVHGMQMLQAAHRSQQSGGVCLRADLQPAAQVCSLSKYLILR